MPFIYTPPALNQDIYLIYDKWINLAKNNDYEWTVRLRNINDAYIEIKNETIQLADENNLELYKYFQKNSVNDLEFMLQELVKINCCQITKKDNVIYFIIHKKLFPPYARPGCAYSIDGHELNKEVEGIHPVIKKVNLMHIEGNWYISKNLLLSGIRIDSQYSIPSSLFDNSKKKIDNIQTISSAGFLTPKTPKTWP